MLLISLEIVFDVVKGPIVESIDTVIGDDESVIDNNSIKETIAFAAMPETGQSACTVYDFRIRNETTYLFGTCMYEIEECEATGRNYKQTSRVLLSDNYKMRAHMRNVLESRLDPSSLDVFNLIDKQSEWVTNREVAMCLYPFIDQLIDILHAVKSRQPIAVYGKQTRRVCDLVICLVSLCYSNEEEERDWRPILTLHDPDCLPLLRQADCSIVGFCNPMLLGKAFAFNLIDTDECVFKPTSGLTRKRSRLTDAIKSVKDLDTVGVMIVNLYKQL